MAAGQLSRTALHLSLDQNIGRVHQIPRPFAAARSAEQDGLPLEVLAGGGVGEGGVARRLHNCERRVQLPRLPIFGVAAGAARKVQVVHLGAPHLQGGRPAGFVSATGMATIRGGGSGGSRRSAVKRACVNRLPNRDETCNEDRTAALCACGTASAGPAAQAGLGRARADCTARTITPGGLLLCLRSAALLSRPASPAHGAHSARAHY